MKKGYLLVVLTLLMCVFFSCEDQSVNFYPGFDFVYDKSKDEITVVGYTEWDESMGSLKIPESLYGKPVTAIGYECEADKYGDPIGNYSIDGFNGMSGDYYLKELVLPQTVKEINNFAFTKIRYDSFKILEDEILDIEVYLEKIILLSKNPPKLYEYSLKECLALFYVPKGSLDSYKTAPLWSDYADRIFSVEEL